MKVLGNLNLLKKEIKESYSKEFEEFSKDLKKEFDIERQKIDDEQRLEVTRIKKKLENEEKKIFQTVLSEDQLNAKKEFENKREDLINKVFTLADEKIDDVLTSQEYIGKIKEFVKNKKKLEISGSKKSYKKIFPKIVILDKIKGIIVKEDNTIYDFSYSSFIASRKLDLRHKISKILFENVN